MSEPIVTPKKTDVLGDVIKELPPVGDDNVTLTVKKAYAVKLGKSVTRTLKCDNLAETVKAKDNLAFLKSLNDAGVTWEDLEVTAEVRAFVEAYL